MFITIQMKIVLIEYFQRQKDTNNHKGMLTFTLSTKTN